MTTLTILALLIGIYLISAIAALLYGKYEETDYYQSVELFDVAFIPIVNSLVIGTGVVVISVDLFIKIFDILKFNDKIRKWYFNEKT